MYNIISVTNRKLCKTDFLKRISEVAKENPKAIILREKDLSENEYKALAVDVLKICSKHNVKCILHSFVKTAEELNAESIHVPMHILREMSEEDKSRFKTIGASCHSVEEAVEAEKLGCTYITAGHVFVTDCKKGLAPRGLDFLENVCKSVSIPVYAIGGIGAKNIDSVVNAGAEGGCIMSGIMQCESVHEYFKNFI